MADCEPYGWLNLSQMNTVCTVGQTLPSLALVGYLRLKEKKMRKAKELKTIPQMSRQDWLEALQKNEASCYIKPNMHRHDSGYRCFEVGYLITDKDGKRCEKKLILSEYSDHLQLYNYNFSQKGKVSTDIMPNMDILLDGYIRVWMFEKPIWWGSLDWTTSSAQLSFVTPKQ